MAIFLGATANMSKEDWLEMRCHGADGKTDVTLGGSDSGYILDDVDDLENVINLPFDKTYSKAATHKEQLWQRKRCEYLRLPYKGKKIGGNAINDGVFNESYVAARYTDQTGEAVLQTPGMYQHETYRFAIANPDGFILQDDAAGMTSLPVPLSSVKYGFEAKTTDIDFNKEGIMKWKAGIAPFHYICQCMHYMFVLGISSWKLMCIWGIRVSDYALITLYRDAKFEEILAENEYAFIESVKAGTPPPLPIGKDYLLKVVKEQYAESHPGKLVRFNYTDHGGLLAAYHREDEECTRLNHELKETQERRDEHEALIRALMKDNTEGILERKISSEYTERYKLSLKTTQRDYISPEKLKELDPALFEQCNTPSLFRTLRVNRRIIRR